MMVLKKKKIKKEKKYEDIKIIRNFLRATRGL